MPDIHKSQAGVLRGLKLIERGSRQNLPISDGEAEILQSIAS
jgi:hypothetical protein